MRHMAPASMKTGQQNAHICVVCGENCYTICTLCGVWLHPPNNKKGKNKDATCFLDWHNDKFFGLARDDWINLLKKRKGDWEPPNNAKRHAQSRYICHLTNTALAEPATVATPRNRRNIRPAATTPGTTPATTTLAGANATATPAANRTLLDFDQSAAV